MVAHSTSPQSDVHVCCRNNNYFPPTHSHSPLPPYCNHNRHLTLLQHFHVPKHTPMSPTLQRKKLSTVKSRGAAAAAAVRGCHSASRGTEDVAPYQSDEADLICEDIWLKGKEMPLKCNDGSKQRNQTWPPWHEFICLLVCLNEPGWGFASTRFSKFKCELLKRILFMLICAVCDSFLHLNIGFPWLHA